MPYERPWWRRLDGVPPGMVDGIASAHKGVRRARCQPTATSGTPTHDGGPSLASRTACMQHPVVHLRSRSWRCSSGRSLRRSRRSRLRRGARRGNSRAARQRPGVHLAGVGIRIRMDGEVRDAVRSRLHPDRRAQDRGRTSRQQPVAPERSGSAGCAVPGRSLPSASGNPERSRMRHLKTVCNRECMGRPSKDGRYHRIPARLCWGSMETRQC